MSSDPIKRKVVFTAPPRVELYQGDCLQILPLVGKVDAVVTDPCYGINAARDRKSQIHGWIDYPGSGWDKERTSTDRVTLAISKGKNAVVWGGNYFSDCLPPSSKWLIWDKGQTDFSLADAELAWCSWTGATRRIRYSRAEALQEGKEHATQKPIPVMAWCIRQIPLPAQSLLDPFMGSGTTGVACMKLGRQFIGIEIDPGYFEIAVRRITEAREEVASRLPFEELPVDRQQELFPDPLFSS